MEIEIKEHKEVILKRVPPGDRWIFVTTPNGAIHPSLTDALEAWFQNTGDTNFYIDAKKGTVEVIKHQQVEKPITKYSLYGED